MRRLIIVTRAATQERPQSRRQVVSNSFSHVVVLNRDGRLYGGTTRCGQTDYGNNYVFIYYVRRCLIAFTVRIIIIMRKPNDTDSFNFNIINCGFSQDFDAIDSRIRGVLIQCSYITLNVVSVELVLLYNISKLSKYFYCTLFLI